MPKDDFDELEAMIGNDPNMDTVDIEYETVPQHLYEEEYVQTGEINYQDPNEPFTHKNSSSEDILCTMKELSDRQLNNMDTLDNYFETLPREEAASLRKYAKERDIEGHTLLEQDFMILHASQAQAALITKLGENERKALVDSSYGATRIITSAMNSAVDKSVDKISEQFQKDIGEIKILSQSIDSVGEKMVNFEEARRKQAKESYDEIGLKFDETLRDRITETNNLFRNHLMEHVKNDVGNIKKLFDEAVAKALNEIIEKTVGNYLLKG